MKCLKKTVAVVLAALMLCLPATFVGCGEKKDTDTETAYSVHVTDYNGSPITSGVVAVFFRGDTQVAMQPCGADGTAAKTLPTDEYTVKLSFTGGDGLFYYDAEGLILGGEKTEAEVTVYPRATGETTVINVPCSEESDELGLVLPTTEEKSVYTLKEGCTYVELAQDEMEYFLFVPNRAGIYELSVAKGDNCTFSYYGMPHFIRQSPVYKSENGITQVTVEEGGVGTDADNTTVWVLGAQAQAAGGYIVKIERVGDPAWSVSQEEWLIYETTATLSQCVVPSDCVLKDFDLTVPHELVYNESDGFYHYGTADGALVYAYLTADSEFVDSFQTILNNGTVRAYFYDDDGNFVKKEAYGPCLKEYFAYVDEEHGVYPLTKDLEYIIKSYGAHQGWWDTQSAGFIVDVPGLNAESAWLFMCCYASAD